MKEISEINKKINAGGAAGGAVPKPAAPARAAKPFEFVNEGVLEQWRKQEERERQRQQQKAG